MTAPITATSRSTSPFGRLLKDWRRARGMSQLDVALSCGVSQRHVSFLESGRSGPSRGMVLHLASTLAVPLRQQNAMLLAAGFAPAYGERPLQAPELRQVSAALERTLAQQEPFPAVVVDRNYTLLMANPAAGHVLAFLTGEAPAAAPAGPVNLAELLLDPQGLRPAIENWEHAAAWMIRRLKAEAVLDGRRRGVDALVERLLALPDVARLARTPRDEHDLPPLLVLRFARDDTRLALFSMIASVGTPLDAGLQDLRLEFFFPADAGTEAWFRAAARERASEAQQGD